jgi:hypothetical protein
MIPLASLVVTDRKGPEGTPVGVAVDVIDSFA